MASTPAPSTESADIDHGPCLVDAKNGVNCMRMHPAEEAASEADRSGTADTLPLNAAKYAFAVIDCGRFSKIKKIIKANSPDLPMFCL
jgi:hypothetical protein